MLDLKSGWGDIHLVKVDLLSEEGDHFKEHFGKLVVELKLIMYNH